MGRYATRTGQGHELHAQGCRPVLRGRHSECELLDRLLDDVRAGHSRALVVRGEPGVGKTALLDYAVARASGCRVEWAVGVESEMELPFAGLHQLCAPMLDRLVRVPGPQRDALRTAFGLDAGEAPDRFLVGLAALSLLAEVAAEMPLVCVVDDAQCLDPASARTLAFVARRLLGESIGLLFAVRDPGEGLRGIPELALRGLGDGDAGALLGSVIPGPLDVRVRDRIVAETRGNPLALLELPQAFSPAELAGGFGLPDTVPLAGTLGEGFRRRLESLPEDTRRLLLVAAAEPVGDPALVWRAAERLGLGLAAAAPAAAAGLLELDARVRFSEPLVRSAVYQAASPQDRRSVHQALAEATDPEVEPDRRAWHRAHATSGPDEDVAAELERSAGRAQARGGLAAAAAFLERAVGLTLDPGRRARRALAAAQVQSQAGAFESTLSLLATADSGPLDELERARVELLRARVACTSRGGGDAPQLFLHAAQRLEPLDAALARETYLDLFSAAILAGRLARGVGVLEAARAAQAAPRPARPPRPADLLLDGLAVLVTEGYAAGVPQLRRALRAFRGDGLSREEGLRWLWLACHVAIETWDYDSWRVLSARHARLARTAGALTVLPVALSSRVGVNIFAGDLGAAESLADEVDAVTAATGAGVAGYGALALAAWQGDEARVAELVEAGVDDVVRRGDGMGLAIIQLASAVLYNGLGRYQAALQAVQPAADHPEELWSTGVLPELVEAAARSGRTDAAADALERLAARTRTSGGDWALGVEAHSRALLSEGAVADELYREAIERLGRTGIRVALARAHLLYGEWLRRERRRVDAREHLRAAQEMFAAMRAEGFAARAARELLATGETARKRRSETSGQLTAQETQIAVLARDGLSNPEIAARLFISPRTVEYHLHKIFAKLQITSRQQLGGVLARDPSTTQPVLTGVPPSA
jgi:DNA-binding CsgD family transcriptional regulator